MVILETKRLNLRTFNESDLDHLTAINQDPKVMQYFPSLQNKDQTKQLINHILKHQHTHGFSLYAVEIKETEKFIGFTGLLIPSFDAHFTPAIEIGWRLDSNNWNNGYATEAADAVLAYAFIELGLKEIVSFTAETNKPSRRVMEKIGMHHNIEDDFNHPKLDQNSPLYRHVLYRITKDQYIKANIANHMANHNMQSYDKIANTWAEKRDWHIEKPSIDKAIKYIPQGSRILDIGCGSGKPIAKYLIDNGFDVYGLDISYKLLEHAKKIIPSNQLFYGDIRSIKISMTFDAIFCWWTLFHIHASEHQSVINRIYELLTPKGILQITFADTSIKMPDSDITELDNQTILSKQFGHNFYHSGRPAAENTKLIERSGFTIIENYSDQPGNQVILAKKYESSDKEHRT